MLTFELLKLPFSCSKMFSRMSNLTEALPSTASPSSGTTTIPFTEPRTLNISDLRIGGSVLLAISVTFIVINGFLSWLVFKNWKTIKRSRFFNSFLLGLVLSSADFTLAVLVGLPSSFHLTWMSYFRNESAMRFYSFYIGHFLFEYIFLFRVLVIALLSSNTFLHIQFPLHYHADYESRRKVFTACGVAAAVPLLFRTVPSLVFLLKYSDGKTMTCVDYDDPDATTYETLVNASHYYVPLTCGILLLDENASIVQVDVIILATITILSWLIITTTNFTSLVVVFRRIGSSTCIGSVGISMRQIAKATLISCSITFTFMLTNFPYVCIWWMDYISKEGSRGAFINNELKFYLMILTFFSLIFHPWFFILRLKSFRDLLKEFKSKFNRSARYPRSITMKTSLASPASERIKLNTVYGNKSTFSQSEITSSRSTITPATDVSGALPDVE